MKATGGHRSAPQSRLQGVIRVPKTPTGGIGGGPFHPSYAHIKNQDYKYDERWSNIQIWTKSIDVYLTPSNIHTSGLRGNVSNMSV